MGVKEDIRDWYSGLQGMELTAGNGAKLVITRALHNGHSGPPYFLNMQAEIPFDHDFGPNEKWLENDSDVGWASLLTQLGLPAGVQLDGHDRKILTPRSIEVILRLSVS